MGQTEPGWWRAFAIDHGVRSTRTPDKLIRKPQETNVFDLPTGEPMEAGRLAEVAMNKPKEEIHKRIEKLRAALEVPPLGAFAPRATNPPPIAAAPPQAAVREVAAVEAVMSEKVDARMAEAAQIVPEAIGADPLPHAEPPVVSLLLPQMAMFMPSAFQATLYRIDVSVKRPLLSLPDEDQGQPVEPNAAAELQDVRYVQASRTERHAAIAEGAPVRKTEKGIEAAESIEAIEAVEVNEAPAVAELTAGPEAAQVPVEDLDLGYLGLYGELVAPVSGLRKVEIQEAPGSIAPALAIEAVAPEAVDHVEDLAPTEVKEEALDRVEAVQDAPLEPVEAAAENPDVEHVEVIESQGATGLESDESCVAEEVWDPEVNAVEHAETASYKPDEVSPLAGDEVTLLPAPVTPERSKFRAYELPGIELLGRPPEPNGPVLTEDILEERAGRVEKVIRDFGVKGEVIHVHPGPVVTLYELEPAPGVKSSRVIALSEDIARSMSAVSARVAVIPGRNAIGIELPNEVRETVYLREMLEAADFKASTQKLPLCLGKTIGGEPVIADLARMPHLLVAGTTGSGKSVAINTMILSLLYRFTPEQCRLIMVDPKMLELSVYDGIPHLLTPVVTDPKKAVVALKWAVREMEDRYRKMSKLGVRNIDGFNARVVEAKARGETITRTVQTGFDRETGEAVYEDEVMELDALPYIVVIVDEMADLMMVAGKEIEGAIQRLAQMARAAGIHVILATQRPSVDVITGTIKANFPTRISFQVTSKIDSRTILGEMGAEQLLGQGDMLYMAGGGRITRVHGPFVSDVEVEKVVNYLKCQGEPVYLDAVTADDEEPEEMEVHELAAEEDIGLASADAYEQAVGIVLRHRKASTSYIQRRLQIGYNRAASLMERMEQDGIVGPANHAGKREILHGGFED
ncbi:DNA translocase FtsK [Microvirga sp.]|uniref:DNA translocase FtsK n=1 Tax=Microvirga sp. TaxID=1873136 RepID=UPI001FEF9F1A|nr:DNA translocase FtsK [Microvirga sp.]